MAWQVNPVLLGWDIQMREQVITHREGWSSVNRISPVRVMAVLLIFAITGVLLHSSGGTRPIPIKQPLSLFPKQIGQWKLVDSRRNSSEVVSLLGVDDYLDYSYTDGQGNLINLYIGFYEAVGNGKGYHSPKNCLPGGGWGIDQVKKVTVTPEEQAGKPATVSEMIIREGSDYQVVLYWFQNRGRIIASEYWEKIYLVWDALTKKRRDGSFVRIMAHVPDGDVKATEALVKEFAGSVITELARFVPGSNPQPRRVALSTAVMHPGTRQ